jgi:uncharacterized protein YuzE
VTFELDGIPLISDYDEEADILYLWTEPGARPAVTHEDDSGVLVQLDPDTREFIGLMLVDYETRWKSETRIVVPIPRIEQRVLVPA